MRVMKTGSESSICPVANGNSKLSVVTKFASPILTSLHVHEKLVHMREAVVI